MDIALSSAQGEKNVLADTSKEKKIFPRRSWSWATSINTLCHELQTLVIDHCAKSVLLRREDNYWVLPGSLIPKEKFRSNMEPWYVIPIVQELVGAALPLSLMRQCWETEKDLKIDRVNFSLKKSVVLMETIGDAPPVSNGFKWIPLKEANVFHFFEEALETIRQEIKWARTDTYPPSRLSWQLPGWLHRTMTWMESFLYNHCDASLTEGIAALRSSNASAVLRAKTSQGSFFLKCTAPLANDAAYTQILAGVVPHFVAKPIVVNVENQIMVTMDYGVILEPFRFSKLETDRLSKDYARLQKETMGRTDELLSAGFPDCRPEVLAGEIDKLVLRDDFKSLGNSAQYEKEVVFFCENVPKIKAKIAELNDSKIPATITHNDLLFSNVYRPVHSDHYMFFDWVEGFVGHPFTSSWTAISKDAYLEEWEAYGSSDQLKNWQSIGSSLHNLAVLILRLQEAGEREPHDAEESLAEARSCLRQFTFGFRVKHMPRES